MKKLLSAVFIIGLILIFYGQSIASINKGRITKDRKGLSSKIGVYHARFVLDYSRAWNNPTVRYEVLRNELGLNVEYKIDKSLNSKYIRNPENENYTALLIDVTNSSFNMVGKDYRTRADFELYNGSRVTGYVIQHRGFYKVGCDYDFWVADLNEKIEDERNNHLDYGTNYKKKRTTIHLTIIDYLWDGKNRGRLNNIQPRGSIGTSRRL
jgi:hypothetical protein